MYEYMMKTKTKTKKKKRNENILKVKSTMESHRSRAMEQLSNWVCLPMQKFIFSFSSIQFLYKYLHVWCIWQIHNAQCPRRENEIHTYICIRNKKSNNNNNKLDEKCNDKNIKIKKHAHCTFCVNRYRFRSKLQTIHFHIYNIYKLKAA